MDKALNLFRIFDLAFFVPGAAIFSLLYFSVSPGMVGP